MEITACREHGAAGEDVAAEIAAAAARGRHVGSIRGEAITSLDGSRRSTF